MSKKLFQVTACHDDELNTTFETFVLADSKKQAKDIIIKNIWSLSGITIKYVQEINTSKSQILCTANTDELDCFDLIYEANMS